MAYPTVALNDQIFEGITDVKLELNTPAGVSGEHRGKTRPMKVTIRRDALNDPQIEGFKFASKKELERFSRGTITLYNDNEEVILEVELKNYFFSGWFLDANEERFVDGAEANRNLTEVMIIYAGEVKLSSGAENHSFTLENFK